MWWFLLACTSSQPTVPDSGDGGEGTGSEGVGDEGGDDEGGGDEGGGDEGGGDEGGGDEGGGDDTGAPSPCPDTPFGGDPTDLDYDDYPVFIDGTDRRFQSIQDAIWGSADGDTVVACPGTYHEVVDFKGRVITLTTYAGPAHTVIDAQGKGPAVRLRNYEPAETVLEGFTLTGGAGEEHHGGGVWVEWGSPTIRYNVIVGNEAGIGGGVYVRNGGANVHHNLIAGNRATEGGGGIVCTACVGSVRFNTFYLNEAGFFGSFSEWYWGTADLVGNIVVHPDDGMVPLYYREHRGPDFETGPNLVWPGDTVVEGMAEDSWPEGEWVKGDPALVDPEAGDFRLGAGSPATDAGPSGETDDDGSPADLGAFGGEGGTWPWDLGF